MFGYVSIGGLIMNVIVDGKIFDDRWIGKCTKCNAVVAANTGELGKIQKGDYRSDNEDFSWEDCPFCKETNMICFHTESSKTGIDLKSGIELSHIWRKSHV